MTFEIRALRVRATLALTAVAIGLGGCATASNSIATAYVSPLQFQSYDQGREAFQATARDVVWNDEEPPLAEIALRRQIPAVPLKLKNPPVRLRVVCSTTKWPSSMMVCKRVSKL